MQKRKIDVCRPAPIFIRAIRWQQFPASSAKATNAVPSSAPCSDGVGRLYRAVNNAADSSLFHSVQFMVARRTGQMIGFLP